MSYDSVITALSPAGRWKLDDTSGTTAVATVGTNGTYQTSGSGSTLRPVLGVTPLLNDGGFAIDTGNTSTPPTGGSSGYVICPFSAGRGAAGTFVFWAAAHGGGAAGVPMMRDSTSSSGWFIDISGTNPVVRINGTSHTVSSVTASTLRTGSTHMYALSTTGSTVVFYIDGVQVDTWTQAGNFSTMTTAIRLGNNGTQVQPYGGYFDDLAYFNSVIGPTDIAALYAAGTASPPVAYTGGATPSVSVAAASTAVVNKPATAARTVAISATSAVRLGITGTATKALTLASTSAAVRGKLAGASPVLSIGAVSAAIVVSGLVGQATRNLDINAASAAALGISTGASSQLAIAADSSAVRGKVAAGSHQLNVSATSTGALGRSAAAAPTLAIAATSSATVVAAGAGVATPVLTFSVVADAVIVSPPRTQIDWIGGRRRDGIAIATWDPPVVAIPQPATSVALLKATAIDDVAITGARATLTSRTVAIPRPRHRIIVAGGDRTLIRGIITPEPTTGLIEPLLYGSGSIRWPQFHGAFERPGHGAWSWLTKYAPVKVQYVDDNDHVIDTDFRGFIGDFATSGRELTSSIIGEATGRGGRTWRPKPFVRDPQDIGHLAIMALRHGLRLPTMDKPPVTGIEVPDSGSQWQLDFLTSLTGRSTTLGGAQWTIMPDAHGRYRMFRKDVETIDFTVYVDDSRVRADLRRDFVEEHDREFVTAIGAHGMLIDFGRYPGLSSKGDPPPFPGHLDLGDTGADVFALSWRLFQLGYLDDTNGDGKIPTPDVFTAKLAKAVRQLQDFAGLDETGEVDAATWRVAFKNDGQWSLRGSGIHPAAQKPFTRAFLHNASGQIIGRNPRYDRTRPFSDRAVNMGHVQDRSQARDWAQEDLSDDNAPNLVGTIDITMGAVIAGEHHSGDPLISEQLLPARAIRPGMNALVHHQGVEVLMHVASRDLQDGHTVQIAVDTRGRDALEVWEIHELRHESHINPERQWRRQNRSSMIDRDSMTGWSEIGGLIDSRLFWPGMTWTVFPVVAGEEGQIRDVDFQTVDDPAEFVLAFFGKEISEERLTHLVENPLTAAGRRAWRRHGDDLRDNHLWLYEAGWDDNPLGFHPTTKADAKLDFPEKGDDQVTGRWRDPAGFPYFCENGTVIWVAAFPRWNTHLNPGRLFKVQRDDAL